MANPEIVTVPDVASAAAELIATDMLRAAALGRFVLNLSGGTTPLAVYRLLAQRPDLPWKRVWVAWGDERFVPAQHRASNQRAAREALLDHVAVPENQILPWPYHPAGAEASAERFARTLAELLPGAPRFDLTLLGLGADAHTASLFPGTAAVFATGTTTVVRPEAGFERLSMTAATLSSSRTVAFLVSGEGKRAALTATLAGDGDLDRFPARAIAATERLLWLTDLQLSANR